MGIFKTNCRFCGTRIAVDDIYAGARAHCPGCGRIIDLIPPEPGAPTQPAADVGSEAAALASRPSRQLPPIERREPRTQADAKSAAAPAAPAAPQTEGNGRKTAQAAAMLGRVGQVVLDYLFFRRMLFRIWAIFASLLITFAGLIAAVVLLCMGEVRQGLLALGAVILIRFIHEWCLVLFSINDTLTEIRNTLQKQTK